MDKICRRILADNISRMISGGDGDVRGKVSSWAATNKLQQRQIDRVLKQKYATTIDTLEEIAAAIGCQPWQLLVPNMRMDDLPMLVMGQAERAIYERIRALIQEADKK